MELIRRGNRNRLVMRDKHGQQTLSLPVTLFVVLLAAAFWVILPLMIVGLFFRLPLRLRGAGPGPGGREPGHGKATDFAEDIKKEFQ